MARKFWKKVVLKTKYKNQYNILFTHVINYYTV